MFSSSSSSNYNYNQELEELIDGITNLDIRTKLEPMIIETMGLISDND